MTTYPRAVALAIAVVLSSFSFAADPDREPQEGVLVLRNGFVIQGRITPVHDQLLVTTGPGGEVRLPKKDVEYQCRSLDEAYFRQRDHLPAEDLGARLKLADWCLRNGLPHRAADQLLAAANENPEDARVRAAEERLSAFVASRRPARNTSANPLDNASRPPSVAPPLPTPRRLPTDLMHHFTTVVQPILLNRCATHACHGSAGTSDYKLVRPVSGHATTSRMTQRNLQATLAYVDGDHPEQSPLLLSAETPHGGVDTPPFQDKQLAQLELLTNWIRRAATPSPESIATNRGGPRRAEPASAVEPPVQQASAEERLDADPLPRATSASYSEPIDSRTRSVRKPATSGKAPGSTTAASSNPYDPGPFNSRFHSSAETPAAKR